jgi:hypothetical protein
MRTGFEVTLIIQNYRHIVMNLGAMDKCRSAPSNNSQQNTQVSNLEAGTSL